MKTKFIFHILLMTAVIFLGSCVKEGPAGLAGLDGADGADGANGADGVDGNVTCMVCHAGTTLATKQFQYAASTHKAGGAVSYAGARASCAQCHSNEGFIEYHTTGGVAADISMPNAINCETCHTLHSDFTYSDYDLRASGPVTMEFDGTTVVDLGDASNLCMNCHQTRRPEPNMSDPGETFDIERSHYGPHYGSQSNMLEGIGFAEIAGSVAYPNAGSAVHREQTSCVGCHMGEYSDKQGDHTWKASLASCNSCHAGSSEDFNYGGVQTQTYADLNELAELLVSVGTMTKDAEGSYTVVTGVHDMVNAQAFFNWKGIYYDRSLGAHNPQYINALLKNSIEALKEVPMK